MTCRRMSKAYTPSPQIQMNFGPLIFTALGPFINSYIHVSQDPFTASQLYLATVSKADLFLCITVE